MENHELDLVETELRLGFSWTKNPEHRVSSERNHKRPLKESCKKLQKDGKSVSKFSHPETSVTESQAVGWPPIRSYRKNNLKPRSNIGSLVKVSMDGAPYLRKIDLTVCKDYKELLKALEGMFPFAIGKCSGGDDCKGSEYSLTYEDKDGDLMLVGDVPWCMFVSTCKRLRIMKASDTKGFSSRMS